ncbi:rodlin [Streptomyces sp. NPDC091272]|uniref:rodlin n=1 Tax=Streptomyces sp. NPDC091272 TaxID=3365981 RepID=UPI00382B81C7
MMKKVMATAVFAASAVGFGLIVAPQAMAIADDGGTTSLSGNGAEQNYGNVETHGDMSPQMSAVQGTLNKLCVGLPVKADLQNIVGLVNVGVQDIPVLSAPQNQQCAENSTQVKGDEPLSHLLNDFPVLSGNGEDNS